MRGFRLEPSADKHLDEIIDYSIMRWGTAQADAYIEAMFEEFAAISDRRVLWRSIAPAVGIEAFFRRWRSHVIYWKAGPGGEISIFAILHERMHQSARLRDALDGEP